MRNFLLRLVLAAGFCLVAGMLQAQQSSSSGAATITPAVTPQVQGLSGSSPSSYEPGGTGFLLEDGSFLIQEDGYFFLFG